jgi:signal peptidase I
MLLTDALRAAGTVSRPAPPVPRSVIALIVVCLGITATWTLLAPTAIGGPTTFVVTRGESMLPHLEPNGLMILRSQKSYEVGDVVAYRNGDLNAVVLHRIIDREANRFVLQGDNNDFIDSYRPRVDELLGEEWIYWEGVGHHARSLSSPTTFGLIIFVIALLSLRVPKADRRNRRHRSR